MSYCVKCGSEKGQENICPECGYQEREIPSFQGDYLGDTNSVLFLFLGMCMPVVGLILFFVWNHTKPTRAKMSIIGALIALPFIVVMGIISAFAIPATGQIIDNTQRDVILADALAIETAAKLYCSQEMCEDDQELTYSNLEAYLMNFDSSYYNLTNRNGVVAIKVNGEWTVDLEAAGTGNYELVQGSVPSQSTREQVIEDVD